MSRARPSAAILLLAVLLLPAAAGAEPSRNFTPRAARPAPPKAEPVASNPAPVVSAQAPAIPEPPPVEPPAAASPAAPGEESPPVEVPWLTGELPAEAAAEGNWVWEPQSTPEGLAAHSHPPAKGVARHGLTFAKPLAVPRNGLLRQQVWLDPQNPPKGIALQFKTQMGKEVGVYWEGEEEVFTPEGYEEMWYQGLLPELGQWATLEILAEDMGLEDDQVTGLAFVTFDGRALWGKTLLTEAPPLEGEGEASDFPTPVRPGTSK